MAGISNPYLSQIERGLRRPSAEILQQIARALRISAETLYIRAGILDARDDGRDLAEAILAEPTLTEDQKQTLVADLPVVPPRERRRWSCYPRAGRSVRGALRSGGGGIGLWLGWRCSRCTRPRWPSPARVTAGG